MATKKRSVPLADTGIDWSSPVGEPELRAKPVEPAATDAPQDGAMRRYVGDTAASLGRGAVQGVRMLTDTAGADNAVSTGLRSVEDYIGGLQSASAKADQQEMARILKDAEGKGVLDQVVAGFKAFGVAPMQTMAQAAGTSLPTIGAALIPGVGPAAVAARFAAPLALGAAQGAGGVKSSIYDEVKQAALQGGAAPDEAERRAAWAQSYNGQNAVQIALGAGLGAWAGKSGIEGALERLVHGTGGKAAPGMVARVALGAAAEGIPEAAQGGQEKFASNTALNNAGFKTDPMSGVVANATMEGLAGHAMGGAMGIPNPSNAAAPVVDPAQAAADAIRATKQPEGGPMTRAANAGIELQAQAAAAGAASPATAPPAEPEAPQGVGGVPLDPLPTDPAEVDAMASDAPFGEVAQRIAAAPEKEQQQFLAQLAMNHPEVARRIGARLNAARDAADGKKPANSPQALPEFDERVKILREQLGDEDTRAKIRDQFGPNALNEATYYAGLTGRDEDTIPAVTRERFLSLAEKLVNEALVKPLPQQAGIGSDQGPAPEAIGMQERAKRIGLDTGRTGTMRVGPDGVAVPEVNADAIDTRQAAAAAAVPKDETQARKASAVYGEDNPRPAAPLAIENDTKPTGRMVAGKDGVRAETGTDRIDAGVAQDAYRAEQQANTDIGLTPDVRAVQARNAMGRPLPGDTLNPKGEPFKSEMAANRAQKKAKGGQVLAVAGGWVVRPQAVDATPATVETTNVQAAAVPAPAAPAAVEEGADRPGAAAATPAATGAAGPAGGAAAAVEADGLKAGDRVNILNGKGETKQAGEFTGFNEAGTGANVKLDSGDVVMVVAGRVRKIDPAAGQPSAAPEPAAPSVERPVNLRRGAASANTPVAAPAPIPTGAPSAATRWGAFMPVERRDMLAKAGYTDADQARALSGTDWTGLGETVRKALDSVHKQQAAAAAPATPPETAIDRRNRLKAERAAPVVVAPAPAPEPEVTSSQQPLSDTEQKELDGLLGFNGGIGFKDMGGHWRAEATGNSLRIPVRSHGSTKDAARRNLLANVRQERESAAAPSPAPAAAPAATQAPPAAPAPAARTDPPAGRPTELIELRKRLSVLKALKECLG